jgi:hypothetical protein
VTVEQPTCGQGLAENALLPAKLAELTASLAENLEVHLRTLELDDDNARREREVYQELARRHRDAAARLAAAAGQMAAQRDLPMGGHDPRAVSSPAVAEAFRGFVRRKQELVALLQRQLEEDRRMLAGMG